MSSINIGTGSGGNGTSTLTISLSETSSGGALGTSSFSYNPLTVINANSPLVPNYPYVIGTNTSITVPTTAGGCIIAPPTNNTQSITLKGVSGDTGINLSKIAPSVIAFDSTPPATIVLNCSGTITVEISWF